MIDDKPSSFFRASILIYQIY